MIIKIAIVVEIVDLTYVAGVERYSVARVILAIKIFFERCLSMKCDDVIVEFVYILQ